MVGLAAFRQATRDARRRSGYTQQQLARAIGVHPQVLSHKLNASGNSVLSDREVLAIVATLATWGAVDSRGDADELFSLMAVPPRLAAEQDWYAQLPERATRKQPPPPTNPWHLGDCGVPLRPTPLPQPVTPMIGRINEVAAVSRAVRTSRLVSLTGSGGTGKTRVALAVAEQLAPEFGDGVAFADAGTVTDPAQLDLAILRALGLPTPSTDIEFRLGEALRGAHLLLLVDNMEHLAPASGVIGRLLTRAVGLHVLVTTRVLLRLYGEQQFRVPPLGLPEDRAATAAGIRESEAVQLFLQRAQAVQPGFEPQGEALDTVARTCTALDGLPLAIELAAAKTGVWSPDAIFGGLSDRLTFLTDGARDSPSRQQSLRATLEWSDALLTDAQRRLFLRLGVFVGSFDAPAAAALIDTDLRTAFKTLTELAEQSLLELIVAGQGPAPRFRMLESVREYALARLAETGDVDEARRAHLHHYVNLATGMDSRGFGPILPDLLDRLQVDQPNIRVGIDWACLRAEDDQAVLTDGLRLATAVSRLWNRRASVPEGRTYLQRLLEVASRVGGVPPELRAAAVIRAAMLSTSNGDLARAVAFAGESLRLFDQLDDLSGMSFAHGQLGEVALANDDLGQAQQHFTTQLGLARRSADPIAQAAAYNMLGQTSARLGQYAAAEEQLARSVTLCRDIGNLDGAANALDSLADVAFRRWDIALAATRWAEALRLHRQTGNKRAMAYHLEGCARVDAVNHQPAAALRSLIAADRLRSAGGWVLPDPERELLDDVVRDPIASIAAGERARILTASRERDLAELIEESLADLDAFAASHPSAAD